MPFIVQIREDLSLADLRRLRKEGASVMKTPHVGNVYPNNLLVARMGILMNFYDRTIGARDKNFHPHRVIVDGKSEEIALGHVMTTHARVTREVIGVPHIAKEERIVDCHMRAMQNAMPDADCVVYTDYLRHHADVVLEVLSIVADEHPEVWEYLVTRDGDRRPFHITRGRERLLAYGIYGITDDAQGALVPNILNILLDGIIESRETGLHEVYHLSGPDMVKYIGTMLKTLDALYATVRRNSSLSLPETIIFNLVPVAGIRFAVDREHRAEVDDLIDAWHGLNAGNRQRSEMLRMASDKNAAIQAAAAGKSQDMLRLRAAAVAATHVFYDIARADTFSQYDLLRGRELYVHPWGCEATIREIELMMKECVRQREIAARA